MGLPSLLLSTSLNPALMKVLLNPVHANTSGILPVFDSTGYPSTIFAPFEIAKSTADFQQLFAESFISKFFLNKKTTDAPYRLIIHGFQ